MLKLCVAGVAGRMGNAIVSEATAKGHQIVGAIEAPNTPAIGKTLKELNIANSDTKILSSDKLSEAAKDADVYISFTLPAADVLNIPTIANLRQTHNPRHHRLHTRTKPASDNRNVGQSSSSVLAKLQCRRQHTLQISRSTQSFPSRL